MSSSTDPAACVLRLFNILLRVANRRPGERIHVCDLQRLCECSARTVKRAVQMLRQAHIPLDYDASQRSYLLLNTGWNLNAATLPRANALALASALALLSDSSLPQVLTSQIQSALDKMTATLPPVLQNQMQQTRLLLRQPGGMARDYSQAPLDTLLEAAQKQQTVQMLYDSRNSGTCEQRLADPYRLDYREGRYWEMQAWCHKDGRVKTFALDRVQQARLTGQTFVVQAWDDSDKGVLGGIRDRAWIAIRLRFDAVVAPYAKDRNWPFETTWEPQQDGSLILSGQVRGVEGIVRELLSWRRHVVALGGPELRQRMREETAAMAARYGDATEQDVEKSENSAK